MTVSKRTIKDLYQSMLVERGLPIVCPDCGFTWDAAEIMEAIRLGEDPIAVINRWKADSINDRPTEQ